MGLLGMSFTATSPKTNMAGWKITIFNRRYIFKSLLFPLSCHFFGDVPSLKVTAKAPEKIDGWKTSAFIGEAYSSGDMLGP